MKNGTFNYGDTPDNIIKTACNTECPDGYPMTIKSQQEWEWITEAVNQGIDSHLEALTERSTFDNSTGQCLVHPDELHVLLRRLNDLPETEGMIQGYEDSPQALRSAILTTLEIEEI